MEPIFAGKKILLLCTTDNMIWQFLVPHIKDLESYGATVDCVCAKTGFWFEELKKDGLNMIEVKMKRRPLHLVNLKAYKAVDKLQQQNHYDLVYCQQPVGGMIGRFIGKKYKLPVIYTVHGFFFFKGNKLFGNFLYRLAEKFMSKWTTALITMNEEDYMACKHWKCPTYMIHGIGMDAGKYKGENLSPQQIKESLGLKDEKIILSVSEFIKRKNYKTMLKTFAKLCETRDDVKYIMCGTGELQQKMRKYAQELGIQDKTLFLGYRKDINRIMEISDVFYHQSFHEGLTMGIMEAMYFGLPVVTSNARGNKDLIDEMGGIVTKCKDVSSQVEALNLLLDNTEARKIMGEHNKERVKNYSIDNVREELRCIYKEVFNKKDN